MPVRSYLSAQQIGPVARAVHPTLNRLGRGPVQVPQGCLNGDVLGNPVVAALPATVAGPVDAVRGTETLRSVWLK